MWVDVLLMTAWMPLLVMWVVARLQALHWRDTAERWQDTSRMFEWAALDWRALYYEACDTTPPLLVTDDDETHQ